MSLLEELAHLVGGETAVAGELDAIVAHLADGTADAADVSLELVSDGLELERHGQALAGRLLSRHGATIPSREKPPAAILQSAARRGLERLV